jgi:MerR family mercuric resistance operon transcriptional regulator
MAANGRTRAEKFPIGTLARESGASVETIRYYERIGLLAPPPRSAGGRRAYGHEDLRILTFIRRARQLGFTLEDIRGLLKLGGPDGAPCGDVKEIATRHLELLASTIAQCAGGTARDCAVLNMLDIDR